MKKVYTKHLCVIMCIAWMTVSGVTAWAQGKSDQMPQGNKDDSLKNILRGLRETEHLREPGVSFSEMEAKRELEFDQYKTLLKELGRSAEESGVNIENAGTQRLDTSLISMARAYYKSPDLVDELVSEYGHWKGDKSQRPVVLRPQRLRQEHATEKYRLAWETLLLAPQSREIRFMDQRIFEALQTIGSNGSIPVLIEAFRITCMADVSQRGDILNRQADIIKTLSELFSQKALGAILQCLTLADERTPEHPPKLSSGYTLREKTYRLLADPDNKGKSEAELKRLKRAQKWHDVVRTFDRNGLGEKDREFLNRIEAHGRRDKVD